jgi:aminoglycoside phosphotransferase (APT) family kinase protein
LSVSLPEEVLAFLHRHGLARPGESAGGKALSGGVSSDIWRVDLARGPIVVKRALPRLRVAQVWEAPVERNRYERRWLETANAILPGVAPEVLAGDDSGFFAMQYLPDLPVWKEELRAGRAEPTFAAGVGRRLAAIHCATARRADIAAAFATDASFHALRLEPYLLAAGRVHLSLQEILEKLVQTTSRTRLALVHGDVSPKNILVGPRGAIFLDAECAWYGDPAFDLAFCLNHLLLKCLWVPQRQADFLLCFDALRNAYREGIDWEDQAVLEQRAACLLPGLLLARVDGKSPVEYLHADEQKDRVRDFARRFLLSPPGTLAELGQAWRRS